MVAAVPGDSLGVCSQKPTQFQRAARAAAGGNTGGTLTTPLGQADGRHLTERCGGFRLWDLQSPGGLLSLSRAKYLGGDNACFTTCLTQ